MAAKKTRKATRKVSKKTTRGRGASAARRSTVGARARKARKTARTAASKPKRKAAARRTAVTRARAAAKRRPAKKAARKAAPARRKATRATAKPGRAARAAAKKRVTRAAAKKKVARATKKKAAPTRARKAKLKKATKAKAVRARATKARARATTKSARARTARPQAARKAARKVARGAIKKKRSAPARVVERAPREARGAVEKSQKKKGAAAEAEVEKPRRAAEAEKPARAADKEKAGRAAERGAEKDKATRAGDKEKALRPAEKDKAARAGDKEKAARAGDKEKGGRADKGARSSERPARGSERPSKGSERPSRGSERPGRGSAPPRPALREAPRLLALPLPTLPPPKKATVDERSAIIEKRLAAQSDDFRQRYYASFDMSWIYHDSALEGTVYTYDELTTALRNEAPPADSSLQPTYDDIRRHKEAIEFTRDYGKKKLPITVDCVRKLYLILHPEEGDIKSVKYRKDIPQHRLYFHEYAPPDKIAYKVRQVVDWLNDPETRKTRNAVRIAARAHYDLLRVYPFPVDSGKVSRLFMNMILIRAGLPPSIIHSTERQRYYEALKGSATTVLQMVQEAVENALSSVEKLLDEHESRKRAFVS